MNDRERELVRRGIDTLNASLASLGYLPIGENPEVSFDKPRVLDFPFVVVDKPGVAPMSFLVGHDLDLSIGPYSEVITVDLDNEPRDQVEEIVTRVLRSEVLCRDRWRSVELILQLPGQEPWRRTRYSGRSRSSPLEPRYTPYAPPA